MYKTSIKVSPLDACLELTSRATGLKFYYVGDTDPARNLPSQPVFSKQLANS